MSRWLTISACLFAGAAAAGETVTTLNAFDDAQAIDRFCGRVRYAYVQAASQPR